MGDKNPYISMMIESLQKKEKVLDEIIQINKLITELIQVDKLDLNKFGENIENKDQLVAQLDTLDQGFQSLFDRVKEELNQNRSIYREEIRKMQQMITSITEKSMSIQAEEARNKLTIENHFAKMKLVIKQAKKSTSVAANYYKSMSKLNVNDAQFMDQKK